MMVMTVAMMVMMMMIMTMIFMMMMTTNLVEVTLKGLAGLEASTAGRREPG